MNEKDTPADVPAIVNQVLDKIRQTENLSSDEALSRHLNVSSLAIYRWRNGALPKAARILIPLIINQQKETTQ